MNIQKTYKYNNMVELRTSTTKLKDRTADFGEVDIPGELENAVKYSMYNRSSSTTEETFLELIAKRLTEKGIEVDYLSTGNTALLHYRDNSNKPIPVPENPSPITTLTPDELPKSESINPVLIVPKKPRK